MRQLCKIFDYIMLILYDGLTRFAESCIIEVLLYYYYVALTFSGSSTAKRSSQGDHMGTMFTLIMNTLVFCKAWEAHSLYEIM